MISLSKIKDSDAVKTFLFASTSAKILTLLGLAIVLILISFIIFGYQLIPYDPLQMSENILGPPSAQNLMGTDSLGRDLYSRLIIGTKYSLGISLISVGLGIVVGVLLGSLSGYFGGILDRFLVLIMDSLNIFPEFIIILLISVILGPGIWQTAMAMTFGWTPGNFRLIRSLTLSVKKRGFIEAEVILGATNWHIILKYIAPYFLSVLFVTLSLGMARGTLAVAGLGFLGLGIPPPTPEWGTELAIGRQFLLSGAWWLVMFPGLFVMMAMLGFNLLSEGLDEIFNPTMSRLKR